MSLEKLNTKLKEPELQEFVEGLFPKDHPKNTRFAINFFTSIGQGALTEELRKVY
jgi:pre-mRNA-splicing factor CWC22